MHRASAILCLTASILGCSSSVGGDEPPANAPAAPAPPAIAKLVTRDRSITLFAGRGTVRATVLDANGRLVARDVDIDALETIDASAFEACHASFSDRTAPPSGAFGGPERAGSSLFP